MPEQSNRYRISSDFILQKIGVGFVLFIMTLYWANDLIHRQFTEQTGALMFGTLALSFLSYCLFKAAAVDYDDVQCKLFLVKGEEGADVEIPVDRIDKILFSVVGASGSNSYVVVYRDDHGETKKFRLFPKFFSNDVTRLINATRARNPNVEIRNWSFGINELFD